MASVDGEAGLLEILASRALLDSSRLFHQNSHINIDLGQPDFWIQVDKLFAGTFTDKLFLFRVVASQVHAGAIVVADDEAGVIAALFKGLENFDRGSLFRNLEFEIKLLSHVVLHLNLAAGIKLRSPLNFELHETSFNALTVQDDHRLELSLGYHLLIDAVGQSHASGLGIEGLATFLLRGFRLFGNFICIDHFNK